jgi:WD40-like Beta Propeller Repeat
MIMSKKLMILIFMLTLVMNPIFSSDEKAPKSIMKAYPALLDNLKIIESNIVYETYYEKNWELFVMNADGSNPVNLTNTPDVHEMYPHVSPDGTKICFTVDEMTNGAKIRCVYMMNMDGSRRTKVAERARQACWAPDSKTIAYLKSKYDKFQLNDYATKGIVFYNTETKETREHPNQDIHHLYNICWSKNGKWIVSTVHAGMGYNHTNLAIQVNGDKVYDLGIGGCRPDLSHDGKQIAWGLTDNIIAVADIDLESSIPKVSNKRNVIVDDLHVYHTEWSPDGKYLCYSRGPGGRTAADGPGTNLGIAELVGVKGQWLLCVTPVSGERVYAELMHGQGTYKESDWFVFAK